MIFGCHQVYILLKFIQHKFRKFKTNNFNFNLSTFYFCNLDIEISLIYHCQPVKHNDVSFLLTQSTHVRKHHEFSPYNIVKYLFYSYMDMVKCTKNIRQNFWWHIEILSFIAPIKISVTSLDNAFFLSACI